MRVIIPVFKDCVSASVVGMMDMLKLTENFYNHLPHQKKKWFSVQLVSLHEERTVQNNGFDITCDILLADCDHADLVIVPAIVGDLPTLIEEHQDFVDWLKVQYKKGTKLCSTCNGAFFLASTGYLDGREATTSWFASGDFRNMFPKVKLIDEKIIVDNGAMVTGGATLSFQNLCIYLIEKYYGKEIGTYAAKMFLVEKGKHSQLNYSIFSAQKGHNDEQILETQNFIEQNAAEKLIVSRLAEDATMAERTFIRRFKTATSNTPSEYIQRVKVELAKKLLENENTSIKEICYETGYEDQSYFRNVFKKYTGLTPADYKKQFTFQL
ncbi:GlxA family transcriptional regulator [Dyadobacter bucti]|uniref:GlxA family transcriptional regulator n=1 Tax=Dyadobacter bucti TaxID=2572203 RepID=UPI003F6FAAC6